MLELLLQASIIPVRRWSRAREVQSISSRKGQERLPISAGLCKAVLSRDRCHAVQPGMHAAYWEALFSSSVFLTLYCPACGYRIQGVHVRAQRYGYGVCIWH